MSFYSAAHPSSTNVVLRPAVAADADWAVPLLFAAGPALFSYVFASPSEQAIEILQQAFVYPHHAFSYNHAQVLEVQGHPIGLTIGYSGAVKRQADEKVHQVMARILPLRKLPKILVNLADLTRIKQDVDLQEFYVLGLSILPEFRQQGWGTYLLSQLESQSRSQDCSRICLDIAYTNTPAKTLLERQGYQIACSKSTSRFEQMTRAGGIHRMVKPLL